MYPLWTLTCGELGRLYFEEGKTVKDLMEICTRSRTSVRYQLRKCGHRKIIPGFEVNVLKEYGDGAIVGDGKGNVFGLSRMSMDWIEEHTKVAWNIGKIIEIKLALPIAPLSWIDSDTGSVFEFAIRENLKTIRFGELFQLITYAFDPVRKLYVVVRGTVINEDCTQNSLIIPRKQ